MKTVLVMHRGANGIRGTEVCVIESVKALAHAGVHVIVARNYPAMDAALDGSAGSLLDFDYPELILHGRHTRLPVLAWSRALARLSAIIRQHRPAVIYASGGLPCQLAVPAGRLHGVPVLCHFHHPAERRAYYLWLVKLADAHVFPSNFTHDDAYRKAGISGVVVPNGVDTVRFRPAPSRTAGWRRQLGIADDAVVIGQVGQLVAHKRPDLLLRAFLREADGMRRLHLCLVGCGPMEDALRAQIERSGCADRVTMTGFVDDVLPYYQQVFDINVLASVEEGLGLSVIEGSACGLPAIVADCTGLRETVVAGRTGVLVRPDDEQSLAEAITALAADAQRRRAFGQAARERVKQCFSLQHYRTGIVTALQCAVDGRAAATARR